MLRVADGRAALAPDQGRFEEIHIWHWGMPGAAGSLWYLDPEGDDVTEGAQAAIFLSEFASAVTVPALPPLGGAVLVIALAWLGRKRLQLGTPIGESGSGICAAALSREGEVSEADE